MTIDPRASLALLLAARCTRTRRSEAGRGRPAHRRSPIADLTKLTYPEKLRMVPDRHVPGSADGRRRGPPTQDTPPCGGSVPHCGGSKCEGSLPDRPGTSPHVGAAGGGAAGGQLALFHDDLRQPASIGARLPRRCVPPLCKFARGRWTDAPATREGGAGGRGGGRGGRRGAARHAIGCFWVWPPPGGTGGCRPPSPIRCATARRAPRDANRF